MVRVFTCTRVTRSHKRLPLNDFIKPAKSLPARPLLLHENARLIKH